MKHLKVVEIREVHEWSGPHGTMVSYTMTVADDAGLQSVIQVNAKPENPYKPGQDFWAVPTGSEYGGIERWKRQKAPDAPQQPSGATSGSGHVPAAPSQGAPVSHKAPLAYDDVVRIFGAMTERFDEPSQWNGVGAVVLGAIIRGEVTSPLKAKTSVTYFGSVLETAGIEQDAWDEIDALCTDLGYLTDKTAAKALLIATAGVQSRKDLTAEKAELFTAALRANIAAAKAKRAADAPPDMSDIPF